MARLDDGQSQPSRRRTRSRGKLLRTHFAANRYWQNPFAALLLSCYVSWLSGGNRPNHQLSQVVRAIQTATGRMRAWLLCNFVDWLWSSPIEHVLNEGG
jgi:hypothetical protein